MNKAALRKSKNKSTKEAEATIPINESKLSNFSDNKEKNVETSNHISYVESPPINPIDNNVNDKMIEVLNMMVHNINNNNNYQIQNDDKDKEIDEISNKIENLHNLNITLLKEYSEKEIEYLEKIKALENKLLSSDKSDIIFLQKNNKECEINLNQMNKSYKILQNKYNDDCVKYRKISEDLISLKSELTSEITALRHIKKKLREKIPEEIETSKVELVVKFNKPEKTNTKVVLKEKPKNDSENIYNIRRNTRPEFMNI